MDSKLVGVRVCFLLGGVYNVFWGKLILSSGGELIFHVQQVIHNVLSLQNLLAIAVATDISFPEAEQVSDV